MEFGRVQESELSGVDFTLPGDPGFNKKILRDGRETNPKCMSVVLNGAALNGWGKYIHQKQKKRNF
jgi:hypothetical protein